MISVVVCTRNRARLLAGVLETLVTQEGRFEVLVVDNGSTDDTARVTRQAARRGPVRRVHEATPGLSHARNRGLKEARGEYVAYVDDDCRIPEGWLARAREIVRSQAPAGFGGPFFPFYEEPKPPWFRDAYGTRTLGDAARPLEPGEYLYGGNMAFRRQLLETLGGFPEHLGMRGSRLAYGEETELQLRLRNQRPEAVLFYDPALYVHHLVRPEKTRLLWRYRASIAKGASVHRTLHGEPDDRSFHDSARWLVHTLRLVAALTMDLVLGPLRRDRSRYPHWKNYGYEHTSRYFHALGSTWARWRRS